VRARGLGYVGVVYALALAVGWVTAQANPLMEPLLAVGLGDLAATAVVFVASHRANNTSVYDPYWSVIPVWIGAWFAAGGVGGARAWLVLGLVTLWSARLTFNWIRGWHGLQQEDWRYVDIRAKTKGLYWPASFFGLHLFPSVLTWVGSLPLFPAIRSAQPLEAMDVVATVVTLAAIVVEAVADEQLLAFRRANPQGICGTGLWAVSRHPNYFGEILFWVGLFLFGFSAGGPAWMVIGPLAMIGLFVFASIPMAEKRSLLRRPGYAARQASVSSLVPWFPKPP
jgi:steroid 5-alpha reductase family enzyme